MGQQTSQPDERSVVIHRTMQAPRERVFRAFLEAEALRKWFGPDGFDTVTHEMDARPGGLWRFTMHGPDGTDYPNWVRYLEITAPERIEWDQGDVVGGQPWFRTTITFEEVDGGTRVTLHSVFPDREARDKNVAEHGAVEGGHQTLARLAAFVEV